MRYKITIYSNTKLIYSNIFLMITERIIKYLDTKGITKYKFCKDLGFSNGFLDKSREITTDKYANILVYFPELNPEWLLTGKGNMLRDDTLVQPIQNQYKHTHDLKGVPLIPIEAMAGYGGGDVQVMDYDIQEDYIITPEFKDKGIKYLIRVSGSSMTPKYNNGDLLACRPITDISFIQWGKVYVLDTDQGPLVKRLFPCTPVDDDCLECRSDNFERYPPFKISKTSIRRIAIAVGVLRME